MPQLANGACTCGSKFVVDPELVHSPMEISQTYVRRQEYKVCDETSLDRAPGPGTGTLEHNNKIAQGLLDTNTGTFERI